MNILLEGIFYNGHGLAEGNRNLLRILDQAGYRVRIKVRDPSDKYKVLHPKEIDYISSFESNSLPTNDVYLYNWIGSFARINPDFRINIARTTFETDRIPDSWVQELNKFDEVWVQSRFNEMTFTSSGVKVPLHLIPNFFDYRGFSPEGPALSLPITESFKFLSVFDLKKRKGYDLLLQAFLNEFSQEDQTALVIKLRDSRQTDIIEQFIHSHPKAKRKRPGIYIIDHMLVPSDIASLYRACDAFVLPTRGEGWGRPFFEAMLMELPVIGTNWSGHTDFMNERNAYLVDIQGLVKISGNDNPICNGHYWAEPSIEDLQRKMRLVFDNRAEAKEKAKAAKQEISQMYNRRETAKKVIYEIEKYRR
ncbi:glycosyltransferase [Bacillus sp. 3255]|uniref:glycosyltransferase n=1 Tax=Bacillus sp. 3255 TaxID=2817904 RepID=UPI0028550E71|nr:glycosyltransferase [Bacillus sp. 3255]MDR6883187.1 glycosyltransferase involved in cell wall biosynthesis [Bacillus sp. 3255]